MAEIILSLPKEVVKPALTFPAYRPVLERAAAANAEIRSTLDKVL
jgi:hypothetical protein